MKQELDDLLCQRYPEIFALRNASPASSCMSRGFECGDGWFVLIDSLCECLQFQTDNNGAPQVVARQVKEKFGTLRFYHREATDEQRGMIYMAEAMSGRICYECGAPGTKDGLYTYCQAHTPVKQPDQC